MGHELQLTPKTPSPRIPPPQTDSDSWGLGFGAKSLENSVVAIL